MRNLARLPGIIALSVIVFVVIACGFKDSEEEDDSIDISSVYSWYGNGSANSFTIGNTAQLVEFARIVSGTTGENGPAQSDFKGKTVTLSADINLTNIQWVPIGYNYKRFAGTFDGNGKTITGLYSFGNWDSGGLFSIVDEGGIVKNIVLTNIDIIGYFGSGVADENYGTVQNCNVTGSINCGSSGFGGLHVGGVVGTNYGTVKNCSFSGDITGFVSVGGIVGSNGNNGSVIGIVQNCYSTGTVSGSSDDIGGVVGDNYKGTVQNCFSTSSVNGSQNGIGGVVGTNQGMVQNCYATGNVSGNWYVGGVAGDNRNGIIRNSVALNPSISASNIQNYVLGRVSDNYNTNYTNNYGLAGMAMRGTYIIAPDANGPDGADVSAVEAATQSWWTTAVNWDFNTVWEWDSARSLPKLRM